MKKPVKLFSLIFLVMFVSCQDDLFDGGQISEFNLMHKSAPHKTTVAVVNPILDEVVGSATLHRTEQGITFNYKSNALTPGYAYTVWIVVWNRPLECGIPNACMEPDFGIAQFVEVEVMSGGGHVVGNSGKGNFGGHLNAGDVSGSINELFGLPPAGGLQEGNVFNAEIHLVLRSHGPAIPGEVHEQISTYAGGCDAPFAIPPFTAIPDEPGECGDIEFAIFSPFN